MRITCPSCAAHYEVPAARLRPGKLVRCVRCGADWLPAARTTRKRRTRRSRRPRAAARISTRGVIAAGHRDGPARGLACSAAAQHAAYRRLDPHVRRVGGSPLRRGGLAAIRRPGLASQQPHPGGWRSHAGPARTGSATWANAEGRPGRKYGSRGAVRPRPERRTRRGACANPRQNAGMNRQIGPVRPYFCHTSVCNDQNSPGQAAI